jgi:hypothetical protein
MDGNSFRGVPVETSRGVCGVRLADWTLAVRAVIYADAAEAMYKQKAKEAVLRYP